MWLVLVKKKDLGLFRSWTSIITSSEFSSSLIAKFIRFLQKTSKYFLRSTFSYLNTKTTPKISIYPLNSLLAVLVAADLPLFLVVVFIFVPPCCPYFKKYFGLLLALVPIFLLKVLFQLAPWTSLFVSILFILSSGSPIFD